MKRIGLTTLIVSICLITFGQNKIDNKLTAEHQNINGTKISVVPPKGFTDGRNFFGFQQTESGSSIMVLDIPGSYSEVSAGITKENLLSKGIEASQIEKLIINELPATFVTGTQKSDGSVYTKFVLVFGTNSETLLINGVYPENLKELGNEIKKSMLSVYYEADKKINPFDALDYTIDVSKTKLKFGKSLSNSLIFSVDGQIPTASSDKTILIVGKSFSEMMIKDKRLFCINRLKQIPVKEENIEYTNEVNIDGLSGYEILAKEKNKASDEIENIYQVILFNGKLYYIFLGTTNDDTGKSIEEIKIALKTFKRK